ncbi:MAG: hypothetical protein J3T61_00540 [Candidatus Brocadiales bacterium]|nr:hypothetical protein [Candidatus Bathyanammoxibius sp.]
MVYEILWGLLAAVLAVTSEALFRAQSGNIVPYIPLVVVIQLGIATGIYNLLKHSSSLVGGVLVFSFMVWALRLAAARVVLGEPITTTKMVACGLVLSAVVIDKMSLFG